MVSVQPGLPKNDLARLGRFSSALLQRVAVNDRKGNVLVLGHQALPPPQCPCLRRDEYSFGLAMCIFQGQAQASIAAEAQLECSSTNLPLQDAAFHTVILYHVTRDGTEHELDEACRVLAPAGELLVLGINRSSWSGMRVYRHGPVPALHLASVRNRLQARNMVIDRTLGAGLLGQSRPVMEGHRLSSLALPFADLVVVRARHRERPAATRLRLKKYPAGVVPTAIITA